MSGPRPRNAASSACQLRSTKIWRALSYLPNQTSNGNGHANGHTNGNGHTQTNGNADVWACSPKQKELIIKIVDENRLDKAQVEALARDRFNTPVNVLNKLQASGFIKELLEKYPGKEHGNGRYTRPKAGGSR